jgi:hypothetical protein
LYDSESSVDFVHDMTSGGSPVAGFFSCAFALKIRHKNAITPIT